MRHLCLPLLAAGLAAAALGARADSARGDPAGGAADRDRYARIDAHAIAAPAEVERSAGALAAYLASAAQGDSEKVRAIFRWMTDRIDYDVERLRAGRIEAVSPDDVLRTRRSVCSGYADLFCKLAAACGIEAVPISGYAKGVGYEVGSSFSGPTDHAWNAARVDGRWRLIDCTWGAGTVGPDLRFERRFRPFFFMTPPERLIYTHFPSEARWQLIDPPVSQERFERMAHMRAGAFDLGLVPIDPSEGWIEARGRRSLTVAIEPGVHLMASINRGGQELDESLVWIQERVGVAEIDCLFPEAGRYRLDIFGRRGTGVGEYGIAMSYRVDATTGAGEWARFPERYARYSESGAELIEPREGILPTGETTRFAIRVPGARSVAVVIGDDFHDLSRSGDRFEGEVRLRRGSVGIYAAFDGESDYQGLVEYEAR